VGRPGLDPGTLGAIPPEPVAYLTRQKFVLRLATVRFKSSGGEVIELRFGVD